MITKAQRTNAGRIIQLADVFGRLPFNEWNQTVEEALNLSIPCARLIGAGVVTGVADTNDGVNMNAVRELEDLCWRAVRFNTSTYGRDWWNERASALLGQEPSTSVS